MMILLVDKTVYIKVTGAKESEIKVLPEDRIMLDASGVEFEHRESSKRRFIPWQQIREVWQPLD